MKVLFDTILYPSVCIEWRLQRAGSQVILTITSDLLQVVKWNVESKVVNTETGGYQPPDSRLDSSGASRFSCVIVMKIQKYYFIFHKHQITRYSVRKINMKYRMITGGSKMIFLCLCLLFSLWLSGAPELERKIFNLGK